MRITIINDFTEKIKNFKTLKLPNEIRAAIHNN